VTLVKSGGGAFEITVDGEVRYSKKATGVFPNPKEVMACVV
jgi:selT/selW/selH-like putative selenoprotein